MIDPLYQISEGSFNPTHTVTEAFVTRKIEVLKIEGPLTCARVSDNMYWEKPHYTTRVFLTKDIKPITKEN